MMQRVALIDNPASGPFSSRRAAALKDAASVLRAAGATVEVFETTGMGGATSYAHQAVQAGFDTILACGGDGTVHEILQVLVGTTVALGVIPFGTANALAADLGLTAKPAEIARVLLEAVPTRIPVGKIHYRDLAGNPSSRHFIVAAGVGADALLMSRMDARLKRRFGYALYLIEAFRIWATHNFPLFQVTSVGHGGGPVRQLDASQLLAVRVRSFGGALRELAPGAAVGNGSLCLLAFCTRSRIKMLRFLLAVLFRRHTFNGAIEVLDADSVECELKPPGATLVFVEADGEVLGQLPARIEVVRDALTLLIPRNAQP